MVSEVSKNKIKWLRSLRLKKNRDDEGLFILEGEKMVLEAIEQRPDLIHTVIAEKNHLLSSTPASAELFFAGKDQLEQISELKTPNKLIAVLKKPEFSSIPSGGLRLVLCDIQDPGNMGTILRIADWFGISEIICSKGTVDCYNEKVLQACMGSILRVPVRYTDLSDFLSRQTEDIYAADLQGENIYKSTDLRPGLIMMGNEGRGIPKDLEHFISRKLFIPRVGGAESLNVAVATGIILSEFRRQQS